MYSQLVDKNIHQVSAYQPSRPVIDLTIDFKKAFGDGITILNRGWEELNNHSVINRMNIDQRAFNAFVNENTEDEAESWKWKGTRSMALKKTIDSHAHLTAVLSVPMAFAQNDKQEEDREMSEVMRDVLEWMAVNSEYRESYVNTMMGALVNPATWMGAEFVESMTTVKERGESGEMTSKEVIDEELSGFRAPVYSADQVLITNAYEQNTQRQYIVIKRLYKPYKQLEKIWNWHDNWGHVTAGVKTVYSDDDGLFYDIKDDEHSTLVEEATGWCRQTDTEVTFLNGIYMGDTDVDENMIKHRDNYNIPKVPLVPFGYQRINEHFFYWKSLVNRLSWDNSLIDAMYENQMNREAIDLFTPMAMYGVEDFSSNVVFPGAVVSFENPDAKAEPLLPPGRGEGYRAIQEIERSMDQASTSDVMGGTLPDKEQKAFNVSRAEQNARTILKGAIRSVSFSVMRYGDLMKDIALRNLTTAQIDEITGAENYRTFVLKDQMVDGKNISKKIIFSDDLVGKRMTEDEAKEARLKLLEETDYPSNKEHIYKVNPHLWSKMKYLIRIEPDAMLEKNSAFEQSVSERMYALLRQDPLVKGEGLVRKVLNTNFRGEADDLIEENPQEEQTGNPKEQLSTQAKIAKQVI